MSGTLITQNLQGPASGSNANKVIIPSGHTLDASEGAFIPEPDQVVQYKWYANTSNFDSTAGSYTAVQSVNFTPKKSGNRIVARFSSHLYKYNYDNYPDSYARLAIDGSQVWQNNYITYLDTASYMYTLSVVGSKLATGTSQIAIEFSVAANGHRTYFYGNTGGMEVWEIAQ